MVGALPRVEDLTVDMVMSRKPVTAYASSTIADVAKIMRDRDVGSVVILDDEGKPVGIVTERDLVVKVLASGLSADTRVSEVMSKPLITIKPSTRIVDAARIMVKRNVRRLIVVEGDSMVGIITEKDILRVAPEMIDILIEAMKVNVSEGYNYTGSSMSGYCDRCGEWSEELIEVDGEYLCPECREIKGG
ncbi:MAG: CBS domain-containing protein [archaeon YNP-LCB-003-016]|jgi:CBS domain-containing protein|uniref:CBS domain-containing protein n=1 Tax=Candidatus Culexarchaeum yellowstonense TaxID=2928963 RepID=UPI0026ECCB1A|nr:CBS domain-containing protein [Candidatus Culexarchaeum yellowstonense]MCC6017995.1 CBS domain-containing protein [Candidatus Verstraetearchaeota archaeon]MCR6668709.1 CBS domain-containing protein [Candidatus Culexarchaeum yellowstonense]MCR6692242.1 CBS domain-containing protein [Candidatus Culexarchaeum yellowstonense]